MTVSTTTFERSTHSSQVCLTEIKEPGKDSEDQTSNQALKDENKLLKNTTHEADTAINELVVVVEKEKMDGAKLLASKYWLDNFFPVIDWRCLIISVR